MASIAPITARSTCLLLFLGLAVLGGGAWAGAPHPPEVVDLQLRWLPQFQFAGYYAAVEKGFYRAEGLDVRLHPGAPDRQPVAEVIAGRAQYAEGNSEVLLARLQGVPLVALAAVFQHSPSVLLALGKSGIRSPRDLIGKRVMFMDSKNDPDFLTMLLNEGIPASRVTILPSSYDFEDLVAGRVDAFNSYLTNEPYYLSQRGIEYTVINPRDYRVDFYSDILFTSEAELRDHPERVAAMRRATLKGWRYAMDHPDEIVDLLLDKYRVAKSREHLAFEAAAMRPLILTDQVEIGHMSEKRWQEMADTFVRSRIIAHGYSLDGFIYQPETGSRLPEWAVRALVGAAVVTVLLGFLAAYFHRINRRLAGAETDLRSANEALSRNLTQIQELHRKLQEQAIRDPLTGLYNRRYLDETLERELARARRDGYPISLAMIDLDHFKQVNDTYGHHAGDEVLRRLGSLLQSHAREGDIPCRFGGEEFVLVLPRLPLQVARHRAEQWRQAFADDRTHHGELEIATTLSVGLAAYPEHGGSADALLASADQALYRAKEAGRNRLAVAGET